MLIGSKRAPGAASGVVVLDWFLDGSYKMHSFPLALQLGDECLGFDLAWIVKRCHRSSAHVTNGPDYPHPGRGGRF
jgi:hypothetical protein